MENKTTTTTVPKKDRTPSTMYTLKSFTGVIKKMQVTKMVTEQEYTELKAIHTKLMQRWIGGDLKL